nr:unnamed protein product [Callosobruchus chinensis]
MEYDHSLDYPSMFYGIASPLDTFRLFLTDCLKQKVNKTKHASVLDIRQGMTNICRNIDVTVLENVRRDILDRLFLCQAVESSHFEHLMNCIQPILSNYEVMRRNLKRKMNFILRTQF